MPEPRWSDLYGIDPNFTGTAKDRWPCADWCCTAGCTSDGTPGQPCDCGAPNGKGPGRCTCGHAEIRAMAAERDVLKDGFVAAVIAHIQDVEHASVATR